MIALVAKIQLTVLISQILKLFIIKIIAISIVVSVSEKINGIIAMDFNLHPINIFTLIVVTNVMLLIVAN